MSRAAFIKIEHPAPCHICEIVTEDAVDIYFGKHKRIEHDQTDHVRICISCARTAFLRSGGELVQGIGEIII